MSELMNRYDADRNAFAAAEEKRKNESEQAAPPSSSVNYSYTPDNQSAAAAAPMKGPLTTNAGTQKYVPVTDWEAVGHDPVERLGRHALARATTFFTKEECLGNFGMHCSQHQ